MTDVGYFLRAATAPPTANEPDACIEAWLRKTFWRGN